jgi:amino acid adenylation domain-containing protein
MIVPSSMASPLLPVQADCCRSPGPTNPFVEFRIEDVEQSIHGRFAEQVCKHPQRTAVKTDCQELTYQALDRAANHVARAILRVRGPGSEPVGFLLDGGATPLIAILGILKAGNIVVPLEPSFPPARLARVLNHAQAALLLTDNANSSLARELSRGNIPVLNLEAMDSEPDGQDAGLSMSPDSPAYILYTSGSTGNPKGVLQSHRNLLHSTLRYTNSLHISREDRCILLAPCSVAASTSDIFPTLLNGAALLPYNLRTQGFGGLARWLIDEGVTVYHSGPTAFRHLANTLTGAEAFPHLRLVRLGGEPVFRHDVERFRKYFGPDCVLAVTLAATETYAICQYFLDRHVALEGARVPVGYPVAGMEVLLRADEGQQVGAGQVGEIVVRSRHLASGYWRDSERTEAAFQPDPQQPEVRLYRTGDLGLLRPDGCLEYLGRKDEQVKIRGQRVETAEVEAALLALGTIREAAVVGRQTASGDQQLVAYAVPMTTAPTWGAIRQALKDKLPDYMIPSAFVFLERLPLTSTGKVDRRALPPPAGGRPALDNAYAPPRNLVQGLLKDIWEQCLSIRPIGIQDSYFELGGDSLTAEKILALVEHHLGKRFYPGVLVKAPTVEQLAELIMGVQVATALSPLIEIQAGSPGRPRFFYLNGDMASPAVYLGLAKCLGEAQPFSIIQPHGLMDGMVPSTIEAMAADRLRLLRAVQPEGPYFLGGFCIIGLVALEMAQQLQRAGHQVAALVMIAPPPDMSLTIIQAEDGCGIRPALVVSQAGTFRIADATCDAPVHDVGRIESGVQRIHALNAIYRKACRDYVLRPCRGSLTVFQPSEDLLKLGPPIQWGAAATDVEIVIVRGGHRLEKIEEVQVLASCLRKILERCSAGPPGGPRRSNVSA